MAAPGAETFIELLPTRVIGATLNGAPLDGFDGGRLALRDLAETNEVVVNAEMTTPTPARACTGSSTRPTARSTCTPSVPRRGAAHLRLLRPARPEGAGHPDGDRADRGGWWRANGARRAGRAGPLGVRRTPAAGDVLRHAGRRAVPRDAAPSTTASRWRSTAGARSPSTWTRTPTRSSRSPSACLDRYHELFGVPVPVRQVRPGVRARSSTLGRDGEPRLRGRSATSYVFRSAVTDTERLDAGRRSIAHEMAHMWFGDLVTMRWWDDLWLNESFAEYMGTRVTAEATRLPQAWTTVRHQPQGLGVRGRPAPVHPPGRADRGRGRRRAPC